MSNNSDASVLHKQAATGHEQAAKRRRKAAETHDQNKLSDTKGSSKSAMNSYTTAQTHSTVSTLLLRHVPLFAMLPEDQLTLLTTVVSRKTFARGATIIAAGDVTDSLYVVISGTLKVMIGDKTGREIILAKLSPGEYFGEMVPIEDSTRSASVIAQEPGELLVLSKHNFRKCLQDNFEMAMTMLRCSIQRLREADRKIGSLALMDVYGRVAVLLMDMSETIDGQHVITKKITKQEMARMIGASREMVTRAMRDLRARGFIETRDGAIYLRDNIAEID